jgi:outer membrane protein
MYSNFLNIQKTKNYKQMKHLAILFILSISIIFVNAQENLTLAGAIQKALENNYQIKISELDLEIAKSNNSWGTAGRYPIVTTGLMNINRTDNRLVPPNTENDNYNTNNVSPYIQANWILFNGFAVKIRKTQLADLEKISEGNAAIMVENTIQAIILAYNKILLEKEKLSVVKDVLELSRDRYTYTELKKEIGNALTFDLLQAKTIFLADSSTYLLQQLNFENAQKNLSLILGENNGTIYNLTDEFIIPEAEYAIDELLNTMLSSNKTLQNQYVNQNILKQNINLKKSSLYPSVSLNTGVDYSQAFDKDNSGDYSYDYYANFSLNYTLFNGGNIQADIQNAKITEQLGQIQIEQVEHQMSIQLNNYFELYTIRKQLLKVADESLKTAKLNLDIAEQKYESGAINSFNYRDIQLYYLNAANSKLEAIYNLIDTNLELLRLTGAIITEYQE